jgi:hypothetical protein
MEKINIISVVLLTLFYFYDSYIINKLEEKNKILTYQLISAGIDPKV